MFKKFLESFTLKDIIFIGIIIILFLKMNKIKEKFTWTAPVDDEGFKTKVENALGDNLTAIKNLGNLSKKILDTPSDGTLDLSDIKLKVKSTITDNLEVSGNSTVSGTSTINGDLSVKGFIINPNPIKNGKIYGGRGGSKSPTAFCEEKKLRLCSAKEVEYNGGACQYAHYGSGNTAGYYYPYGGVSGCTKGWNGGNNKMYNHVWCCANDTFPV
jgi:hypothetical protein